MTKRTSDYRKGYDAGRKSTLRATHRYTAGRHQGRADIRRDVKLHFQGKRRAKWVVDILSDVIEKENP